MLDLNLIERKPYEIKMLDGKVLHIGKPPQRLLNKIIQIQKADPEDIAVVTQLYDIVLEILNLNTDGEVYDAIFIKQFDIEIIALILADYFHWLSDELGE